MTSDSNDHEAGGQPKAAGNALVAMGSMGLVMTAIISLAHLELRFIDATGMGAFALITLTLGLWQRVQGEPHS